MSNASQLCLALCLASLPAFLSAAKVEVIQVVDLAGMSTEGGEAKLYSSGRSPACTIEVLHYGEMGKTAFEFRFGERLRSAVKREYKYEAPIYIQPDAKVSEIRTLTLGSAEGRRTLPAEFESYRRLFDASSLARCAGR